MTLQPNSTLQGGKYRIEKVLGQGGFGITYEGIQTGLGRKVAIKEFFMKDFCERDGETSMVTIAGTEGNRSLVVRFKEKFIKEAQMIAELEDVPHIIRIHDIFQENGTAYYVMQFIEGGSLDSKIKKEGALNESIAIKYITQMADALSMLHSKHIMHLDIKPANVLLRGNDLFLIDFGVSKHYDSEGEATTTTPVGRSKGYAPIEQYRQGGVQSFSPETDIYSLGATAYFFVTGQVPPEATELIIDPIKRPNGISDSLWNAIQTSMSPNKNNRPHSIAEFMDLLGEQEKDFVDDMISPKQHDSDATILNSSVEHQMAKDEVWEIPVGNLIIKMAAIEGGTFQMGATIEQGDNADDDERPIHNVNLNDYYIATTEVTQELWKEVMGSNPSKYKGDRLPVEQVSWNDCQEFIGKLNQLTGENFRLPTEAEWEYAARGGKKSKGYKYSGSNDLGKVAWYKDNSEGKTHEVATKQPNELGLYDMSGNVFEWVSDWKDLYTSEPQVNPTGAIEGLLRVRRGGSWSNEANGCRISGRYYYSPSSRYDYLGFRLALPC